MGRIWRTFRMALFLHVAVCVAVALVVASAALILFDRHVSREYMLNGLRQSASSVGVALATTHRLGASEATSSLLGTLKSDPNCTVAVLLDAEGKILASFGDLHQPMALSMTGSGHDHQFTDRKVQLVHRINTDEQQLTLVLQRSLDDMTRYLQRDIQIAILTFAITMILTLFVTSVFQRRFTRPIKELRQTASALGHEGNYQIRARKLHDDELGELTDSFNEMIGLIEAREKELIAIRADLKRRVEVRTRELKESERQLRRAVVDAPYPAIIHAEDGEIILISRAWKELAGYRPGELPDIETLTRKTCGENADTVHSHIKALYGIRERVNEGMFEIRTKSGEIRFWEFSSAPLGRLSDGRRAVISMATDLTERLSSEKKLAETVARVEVAIRATRIGYWDWNIITNEVFFSAEWKKQIGYEPDELENNFETWANLLHPDDAPETLQAVQDFVDGVADEYRVVFRLRHKDGSYRWILTRAEEIRDAHGRTERLIGCHVDITELKETETKLRETSAFLDSILENIPNMIFVKEAKELRFVRFNKAGEELLGRSREDMVGKNDYDFFPKAEADFFTKKDREVFMRTDPLEITEEPIHTADKGVRYLHTKKVPIRDADDEPAYLLGISEDITERKAAEDKLQQLLEELRRSNEELEQFAYVASHDLQEPLRMVTSYLQLIESRYNDQLDDTAREFIAFAVDGAARMRQLILDLLSYSRVGTHARPMQRVSTSGALEAAMSSLGVLMQESEARIDFGELPDVMADEPQLVQLFQNLLSNAMKFRSEAPLHVRVTAETDAENGFIHFRVTDNGIGIDPEHHKRIFVIFQRLHGRDEYAGTGIGLALCQKIVERHRGRLWVESAPGKGSTFHFTLRRAEAPSDA